MEIRRCNFRRCNNDISEMRKDAKFCSVNCRKGEQTYRKRKQKFIDKWKNIELEKIENYKNIIKLIKEEYKNGK